MHHRTLGDTTFVSRYNSLAVYCTLQEFRAGELVRCIWQARNKSSIGLRVAAGQMQSRYEAGYSRAGVTGSQVHVAAAVEERERSVVEMASRSASSARTRAEVGRPSAEASASTRLVSLPWSGQAGWQQIRL